jgi:hypothetical protein
MSARAHGVSPYRYALDQAQEALLASVSRSPASPESSVTISRNARGVTQFEVTVRGEDVELCVQRADEVYVLLDSTYPYPVTNGGTE